MRAVIDTNFIRNLGKANKLSLLSEVIDKMKWEFYLPKIVQNELEKKSIPKELQTLLESGKIRVEECDDFAYKKFSLKFFGLDEGELEAICIVDKCEDRTFRIYLILTDDEPAQKKASSIGMSSLGTVGFLFEANKFGLLPKRDALISLVALEKNGFFIDPLIRSDFETRVQ